MTHLYRWIKRRFDKYGLILLVIIAAGLFLRLYKAEIYLPYGHDNDLESWIVKDIVLNKHFRLVGQETSTQGIYIGALYYYLLVPFYLLAKMQPSGTIFLSAILGAFTIWSAYYVFGRLFKKKEIGLIGAFIYAIAFFVVMSDRGAVPTTPVFVWSIWFLYGVGLIFLGQAKKALIVLGVLVSLIWHLIVALVPLTIVIPLALILSRWKFKVRQVISGIAILLATSIPFFVFEFRHNFQQIRAVANSFASNQGSELSLFEQFRRVVHILSNIVTNIVWYPQQKYYFLLPLVLALALAILVVKKKIARNFAAVLALWTILPIMFFTFYSKQVSEYYLNATLVVWIVVLTLFIYHLLVSKKFRFVGVVLLILFAYLNLSKFFSYQDSRQGYIYRKALVAEIKRDAQERGYPCVAVSYITNPGYDLGYRYFFWLENMHVNRPDSLSPVYTIVFPLKKIFKEDKTFGALGLIYPDYKRYSKEGIARSCSGANSNLTDPLFGYTE